MNLSTNSLEEMPLPSSSAEIPKQLPGTPTNSFNKAATAFGDVPSRLFQGSDSKEKAGPSKVEEFARSKALTPVDGLAKGLTAFASGVVTGITGVVTEPINGAAEKGAEGFFSGMGKGLLGVVFKPISGALEMTGKIGEGFVNTPGTLAGLVRANEYTMYGIPLLESFESCKAKGRKHVVVKIIEFMEGNAKSVPGLFVFGASKKVIRDLAQAYDQGLDPDLITLDPHVATGLLLRYLELLPEPLIPSNFHPPLASLISTIPQKTDRNHPGLKRVHNLLNQLPPVNKSVLAELCLMLRKYLKASGSGTIVLDHIALCVGKSILRTGPAQVQTGTGIEDGEIEEEDDDDDEGTEGSAQKSEFSSPEQKAFVLHATKLLIQFYCPGYLTYQLTKLDINLD